VSVVGSGSIDGQGEPWWEDCTACHYPPHNDSRRCEVASRPKLLEFQFVDGLTVRGSSVSEPLTLRNSPFWTLTPSYSQNILIRDLRILAPMDRIGNTDGCNLDSCRLAVVENLYINNSDDGVCLKSGLDGFGMNLGIPTEDALVRNITCDPSSRCGFAIGSEMSGGVRNVTFSESVLAGERGINIKPSVGRGGYIRNLTFRGIELGSAGASINLGVGHDGVPLEPGNVFVPLIEGIRFEGIGGSGRCSIACAAANGSACHRMIFSKGSVVEKCRCDRCVGALARPTTYACKRTAITQFGDTIRLPWGVCIPSDAPVNNDPAYPNWGPARGEYRSLAECKLGC
jgi:polygalacturonase